MLNLNIIVLETAKMLVIFFLQILKKKLYVGVILLESARYQKHTYFFFGLMGWHVSKIIIEY